MLQITGRKEIQLNIKVTHKKKIANTNVTSNNDI